MENSVSRKKPNSSQQNVRIFKSDEMVQLKDAVVEYRQTMRDNERERLRERHWMHCPQCGMEMGRVEFRHIDVLRCFGGGGVFMEHGVLESLSGEDSPDPTAFADTTVHDVAEVFQALDEQLKTKVK